ncbi:MAG: hypothetical protein WB987_09425 [Candidatus Acidiferrales bacterium]
MSKRWDVKFAFGALVAALSFAPAALGQAQGPAKGQSQAKSQEQSQTGAQTQDQNQGGSTSQSETTPAAQTKTQGASAAEPQMQSQEAPPPDSLGEAARKARAQKSKAPAAKVYTEDKIAGLSGHGVSVVGDENQGGGDSADAENSNGAPGANGSAPGGKNEEQFWRQKARAIHDQMAQIDDRISKIQEEIQKYGAVSFDPATGLQQNVIYIEDRNAQIKQLEAQKARLQTQMDSLEEEGRKAGADSGWFR